MLSKRKAAKKNVEGGGFVISGGLHCDKCPFFGKCNAGHPKTCAEFCSKWLKKHPKKPKKKQGYHSDQHTICAVCGSDKHTPIRRDEMGGYVCLTCIDKRLDELEKAIRGLKNGDGIVFVGEENE